MVPDASAGTSLRSSQLAYSAVSASACTWHVAAATEATYPRLNDTKHSSRPRVGVEVAVLVAVVLVVGVVEVVAVVVGVVVGDVAPHDSNSPSNARSPSAPSSSSCAGHALLLSTPPSQLSAGNCGSNVYCRSPVVSAAASSSVHSTAVNSVTPSSASVEYDEAHASAVGSPVPPQTPTMAPSRGSCPPQSD